MIGIIAAKEIIDLMALTTPDVIVTIIGMAIPLTLFIQSIV
jgi:hypothetical protein